MGDSTELGPDGAGTPSSDPAISDAAMAEARARAYALLADLLDRGPTGELATVARQSPDLSAALDGYEDEDDLAADHYFAFSLAQSVQEGALLDPRAEVGGPTASELVSLYRECGFAWDPIGPESEHLATRLRALCHLSGAEADARQDERADVVERVEALARRILDEHLLRSLPVLVASTERLGRPFPTALISQIEALALVHRDSLGAPWPATFELPPCETSLDDLDVGLRQIGEMLSRPAQSGVLLSRADVEAVARAAGVPRGFGDRSILVKNAFQSAAHLEAIPALTLALELVIESQRRALRGPRYDGLSWLAALTAPWLSRCRETTELLARLRAEAG